jgi:hypothetical protein
LDAWLNDHNIGADKYAHFLERRRQYLSDLENYKQSRELPDLGAARTAFEKTGSFAAIQNWLQSGFIPFIDEDSKRSLYYVFHKETVWACSKSLSAEQWQLLVERKLRREQQELDFISPNTDDTYERERITEEMRVEVWRRDNGRCARCGSRQRLEFDHIVPVSKGGGTTVRNLELLCELCNRTKSNSIS